MSEQPENYDDRQNGESGGQDSRTSQGKRHPSQGSASNQQGQSRQQRRDQHGSHGRGHQRPPGQPVQQGPSLVDKLKRPHVLDHVKLTVVTYAVLGAGIGLTGYLILGQLLGGSGEESFATSLLGGVAAISITLVTVLLGTAVAAVFGLRLADSIGEDDTTTAAASILGCYAGYVVMVLVAVLFVGAQLGGGGGAESAASSSGGFSMDAGNLFVPVLVSGVPSALVGGAVAYLKRTIAPSRSSRGPGAESVPAEQPAD